MTAAPTIFHITNHKAGSQWVAEILKQSAPERFVKPQERVGHFFNKPIMPGMIYPTAYLPVPDFIFTLLGQTSPATHFHYPINRKMGAARLKNRINFQIFRRSYRILLIIRDLRDVLISMYYSWLVSHPESIAVVAQDRKILKTISMEEGLLYLIRERLPLEADIQHSWWNNKDDKEVFFTRFEEMLQDEQVIFEKIVAHCRIDIPAERLMDIVRHNSFSERAGRKPGEEDVASHYRKGISGDWRNHFSERVAAAFKDRFGRVLIETGYEKNLNW